MPDNKINERLWRIRAIDELFSSQPGKTYTSVEIIQFVLSKNPAWEYNRFKLARDLKFLTEEKKIKIIEEKCSSESGIGRSVTKFGYPNNGKSLFEDNFSREDRALIIDIMETLHLKGINTLPFFMKFSRKYQDEIPKDYKPIISFTKNPIEDKTGNIFANLLDKIRQKEVISFKMHSRTYPYEMDNYQVHPWYLREYNRRWYLFGWDVKENKIKRYSLDKIHGPIRTLKKTYISPTQSIEEILNTIVGVSLTETAPIEIIFWVSDVSADYVARKTIHKTQEEIKVAEDSPYMEMIGHREHGKFFKMTCENNYELRREMLSFNSELIVLSPETFRQEIKENIERMLKNYSE